jgi:hypothetical protein
LEKGEGKVWVKGGDKVLKGRIKGEGRVKGWEQGG